MFPFAVFSGNFIYDQSSPESIVSEFTVPGELIGEEFAAEDLSADSFSFRLPQAFRDGQAPAAFLLHFADRRGRSEYTMTLRDFSLAIDPDAEESPFYVTYRCLTESREFSAHTTRLLADYEAYVRLKTTEPDDVLSHALTAYPQGRENDFYDSWEEEKESFFGNLSCDPGWKIPASAGAGICLDRPSLMGRFLELPYTDFLQEYFHVYFQDCFRSSGALCVSEHSAPADCTCHPLTAIRPRYLYLGSESCIHLLPSSEQFSQIIKKAANEDLIPVLVLPPVKEREFDRVLRLLRDWQEILQESSFSDTELVVNDWGMAVSAPGGYQLTAGTLLLKRRKDVRLPYFSAPEQSARPEKLYASPRQSARSEKLYASPGQSARSEKLYASPRQSARPEDRVCTLAPALLDQLSDNCGIHHLLLEACGYEYTLPVDSRFRKSLLLPFYRMNTAPDCTLYAACKNGGRGRQEPVFSCPAYCKDHAFLYPKHLSMVGIGNSLMGIDFFILQDEKYLQAMLDQGISRIVFNFQ